MQRLKQPIVALFVLVSALAGSYAFPSAAQTIVRAMSYNIRFDNQGDGEHAWPHRRDRVISIIRYHQPDVVGLQEALLNQLDDLAGGLPDYSWLGMGRDDGRSSGEFSAILYKNTAYRPLRSGTFWLSETPEIPGSVGWDAALPRIVTWAEMEYVRTGEVFLHANTHFDHVGERARTHSAELIVHYVDSIAGELPIILTGDVNAEPLSATYAGLAAAFTDARISSESPAHGPAGTFSGFVASREPMRRIDYVFVSKDLVVRRFATLAEHWEGSHGSDHLPVVADVELPE